jgi:hypothetical protein
VKANVWFRSLDHEIDHREKNVELEVKEGMLPELEHRERRWTFSHTLTNRGPRGGEEQWLVYTERAPATAGPESPAPG